MSGIVTDLLVIGGLVLIGTGLLYIAPVSVLFYAGAVLLGVGLWRAHYG